MHVSIIVPFTILIPCMTACVDFHDNIFYAGANQEFKELRKTSNISKINIFYPVLSNKMLKRKTNLFKTISFTKFLN